MYKILACANCVMKEAGRTQSPCIVIKEMQDLPPGKKAELPSAFWRMEAPFGVGLWGSPGVSRSFVWFHQILKAFTSSGQAQKMKMSTMATKSTASTIHRMRLPLAVMRLRFWNCSSVMPHLL